MNEAKVIRGQVRIAVKEELPNVLQTEFAAALRKELAKEFNDRFTAIAKHIQNTLDDLESRSKDVQAYVIRQSAANVPKQES